MAKSNICKICQKPIPKGDIGTRCCDECGERQAGTMPTPKQIRLICKQIREGWSEAEELYRRTGRDHKRIEVEIRPVKFVA